MIAMGQCPNCDKKDDFLEPSKCVICGKAGCDECFIYMLTLKYKTSSKRIWACSEECYLKFENELMINFPLSKTIGTDNCDIDNYLWSEASFFALLNIGRRNREIRRLMLKFQLERGPIENYFNYIITQDPKDEKLRSDIQRRFFMRVRLLLGKNLESAGRLLEAASIYNSLWSYDKGKKPE